MKVTLYTIGCFSCNVLKDILVQNNISFEENSDRELMINLGFNHLPVLEVDGQRMEYDDAVRWVTNNGGQHEEQ